MTRKAHNVDKQRTEEAHFLDKRSYWTNAGHEYLFGDDKRNRRQELFDRIVEHSTGLPRCQQCGIDTSWNMGHMHHKQGGLVGRCDCLHNLEWLCPDCHRKEHVHVMSGKVGT